MQGDPEEYAPLLGDTGHAKLGAEDYIKKSTTITRKIIDSADLTKVIFHFL